MRRSRGQRFVVAFVAAAICMIPTKAHAIGGEGMALAIFGILSGGLALLLLLPLGIASLLLGKRRATPSAGRRTYGMVASWLSACSAVLHLGFVTLAVGIEMRSPHNEGEGLKLTLVGLGMFFLPVAAVALVSFLLGRRVVKNNTPA